MMLYFKFMKRNYPVLIAVFILIINAIIVYFGRIYFPKNFHPETVSFFENYWVLTLGLCFVVTLIALSILSLLWVFSSLIKEIKSLF